MSGMGGGVSTSGIGGGSGIAGTGGGAGRSALATPALWPIVATDIATTALHPKRTCLNLIWLPFRAAGDAVSDCYRVCSRRPRENQSSYQPIPDSYTLLKAYTIEGATVNHRDKDTDSLEAGRAADFITIDRNLFQIPPEEIGKTRVLATFLDGQQVYAADS